MLQAVLFLSVHLRTNVHSTLILTEAMSQMVNNPSALRFHGITDKELESTGVKASELIYLVSNFMAGQVFYEQDGNH